MAQSNFNPGQELSSINFAGMIGGPLTAVVDAQSQAALASVSFIKSVGFSPDTTDVTGTVVPGTPVYVSFNYPKMLTPFVPGSTLATPSVTASGANYSVGDVLSLGSGATVTVKTISATGAISSVSLDAPPSAYTSGSFPATGGAGSGANITITINNVPSVPAQFDQMKLEVPILTMLPIPFIRIDYAEIDFHAKITSMEYQNSAEEVKTTGGGTGQITGSTGIGLNLGKFLSIGSKKTSSVQLSVNASSQRSVKEGFKIDKTFQLGVKVRASQDEMPAGMEKILGILEDAIVAQPM